MKRLVAISYKTEGVTLDALTEWLFDNVGEPNRSFQGTLIAADHERKVTFNFASPEQVKRAEGRLRIAVWGDEPQEEMWAKCNDWASVICQELQKNIETESHELWEDEGNGLKQKYHAICPVDQVREIAVGPKQNPWNVVQAPKKAGNA